MKSGIHFCVLSFIIQLATGCTKTSEVSLSDGMTVVTGRAVDYYTGQFTFAPGAYIIYTNAGDTFRSIAQSEPLERVSTYKEGEYNFVFKANPAKQYWLVIPGSSPNANSLPFPIVNGIVNKINVPVVPLIPVQATLKLRPEYKNSTVIITSNLDLPYSHPVSAVFDHRPISANSFIKCERGVFSDSVIVINAFPDLKTQVNVSVYDSLYNVLFADSIVTKIPYYGSRNLLLEF